MPDLLPVQLEDLIAFAEREVKLRERVYYGPFGRVAKGKMRKDRADRELMLMRAIADHLKVELAEQMRRPA